MRLVHHIVFNWTCPHCGEVGFGKCDHTTEYLNAHCGYCRHWTQLDYHRLTDAPEAALKLDNLALGSRTSPALRPDSPPIKSRIFTQSNKSDLDFRPPASQSRPFPFTRNTR
jgi:hypothetical protein